jgi:hypothetical protein
MGELIVDDQVHLESIPIGLTDHVEQPGLGPATSHRANKM